MGLKKLGLWAVSKTTRQHFLKYYKEMAKNSATNVLNKTEIEQVQLKKFKELLNYAIRQIPFYRQRFAGIDPQNMKSLDDIKQLPVLSKEELKAAGLTAVAQTKKRLITKTTSGTTGPPFTFMINQDFFSLEIARNLRIFDLPGLKIGEPWVLFTPLRDKKNWIFSFLSNRLVLDANRITLERTSLCCPVSAGNKLSPDENMIRYFWERIKQHKPKAIYSYPSALIALATFIQKWGVVGIKIKTIITSGEVLTKAARTLIAKTLEGEVFNLYGTTEFPTIAQECKEHNGLHIFADSYLVEFDDNDEILITDLDNRTMPFIRFKTGDFGFFKNGQCRCGRSLPLIAITKGRVSDLIITPDGKFLKRSFFAAVIKKNPEIKHFEIIYEEPGKLIITLVVNKTFSELHQEYLMKRFQDYTGDSVDLSVKIKYESSSN